MSDDLQAAEGAATDDKAVADAGAGADKGAAQADAAKAGAGAQGAEADKAGAAGDGKTADQQPAAGKTTKTIVGGADAEADDKAKADAAAKDKPYWPADWREKMAEHYAAGDKKIYDKELKRLQRFTDPNAVYGMGRELDNRLNGGGLVKIPGKDAKPEEITAFAKALGWAEKPEEMLGQIALDNGVTIGDADKPRLTGFLGAIHGATSAQDMVSKATNWYYKEQEEAAAALDAADDDFRRQGEAALKEEWGPAFKRRTNALASIFATAPGGTDLSNPSSLFSRLIGGRTADGKVIGNDPEILRWLDSLRGEINPAATVVEDGQQGGLSIDAEIKQIETTMRTDRRSYNKDEKMQQRYRDLLTAREKIRARG